MLHSGELLAVIMLLGNQEAKNEKGEDEKNTVIDSCDESSRLTNKSGHHPSILKANNLLAVR